MTLFLPVYTEKKQSARLREAKHGKKRKRDRAEDEEDEPRTPEQTTPEPEATSRTASTAFQPVNKTDPFYVAGWSRDEPLPPPPFPHAPAKLRNQNVSVEKELASLKPPIYVSTIKDETKITSMRRHHLDVMTTILHTSMLRGDWQRASTAFGLILRTEMGRRGDDIRKHGRWGIGGEILMRRHQAPASPPQADQAMLDESTNSEEASNTGQEAAAERSISEQGFRLAHEYYERLILQYPHTKHNPHAINSTAFYPALFNVWIYEVQDRSERARGDEDDLAATDLLDVRTAELEVAQDIARRMDDIMLGPPYDTSMPLLKLRGMVALWLTDLRHVVADLTDESTAESMHGAEEQELRDQATEEKRKATLMFRKFEKGGGKVPRSVLDAIEDFETGNDSMG